MLYRIYVGLQVLHYANLLIYVYFMYFSVFQLAVLDNILAHLRRGLG